MDDMQEYVLRRKISRLNQEIWTETQKLKQLKKEFQKDKKELQKLLSERVDNIEKKQLSTASKKKLINYLLDRQ